MDKVDKSGDLVLSMYPTRLAILIELARPMNMAVHANNRRTILAMMELLFCQAVVVCSKDSFMLILALFTLLLADCTLIFCSASASGTSRSAIVNRQISAYPVQRNVLKTIFCNSSLEKIA